MSTAKTALSLLALLLGYWTSSAAQPPITSPLIVATVQLLSQTTGIPPTNIFTPQADGLFRISVYTTTTKSHPHALGWFFIFDGVMTAVSMMLWVRTSSVILQGFGRHGLRHSVPRQAHP
jgi:hypothetical protein